MVFMHVFDDFFLQSAFLSNGKQQEWWMRNAPDPKYKYDYWPCLYMHGISWASCIMFPIAWYHGFDVGMSFFCIWIGNAAIHASVDHFKANLKIINLIQDQFIHLLQIVATALILLIAR